MAGPLEPEKAHRQSVGCGIQALLFDLGGVVIDIDFEHIAASIGVPLPAILFFDDLLENVEGARAAGLKAVHVRGPGDVRDALRQEGMIAR